MSHRISRRTFVATAAVAGAGAVLGAPAFAFENQNPVQPARPEPCRRAATL